MPYAECNVTVIVFVIIPAPEAVRWKLPRQAEDAYFPLGNRKKRVNESRRQLEREKGMEGDAAVGERRKRRRGSGEGRMARAEGELKKKGEDEVGEKEGEARRALEPTLKRTLQGRHAYLWTVSGCCCSFHGPDLVREIRYGESPRRSRRLPRV